MSIDDDKKARDAQVLAGLNKVKKAPAAKKTKAVDISALKNQAVPAAPRAKKPADAKAEK